MTQEDLKQYYNPYTDCWKMFRDYAGKVTADTMDDDVFWDKIIKEDCDAIIKRYGEIPLARHLVLDTECGIEDLAKSMKG